jgi:hypothetical protein
VRAIAEQTLARASDRRREIWLDSFIIIVVIIIIIIIKGPEQLSVVGSCLQWFVPG